MFCRARAGCSSRGGWRCQGVRCKIPEEGEIPRGPQGRWRPAGDNECAALVCRIATGESPEVYEPPERSGEEQRKGEPAGQQGWAGAGRETQPRAAPEDCGGCCRSPWMTSCGCKTLPKG